MNSKTSDYRVHYRTNQSTGYVTIKDCSEKEAISTVEKRMPLAKVVRAEKIK